MPALSTSSCQRRTCRTSSSTRRISPERSMPEWSRSICISAQTSMSRTAASVTRQRTLGRAVALVAAAALVAVVESVCTSPSRPGYRGCSCPTAPRSLAAAAPMRTSHLCRWRRRCTCRCLTLQTGNETRCVRLARAALRERGEIELGPCCVPHQTWLVPKSQLLCRAHEHIRPAWSHPSGMGQWSTSSKAVAACHRLGRRSCPE